MLNWKYSIYVTVFNPILESAEIDIKTEHFGCKKHNIKIINEVHSLVSWYNDYSVRLDKEYNLISCIH